MQLSLKKSFNAGLFTPYKTHDRNYFLLFYARGIVGPFFVRDAPLILNTLFSIGEIAQGSADGKVVGNIFYTQSPSRCEGSFALAYSGVFEGIVNTQRFKPKDLEFQLMLKTEHYYVFHKDNAATLLVNPSIKMDIRKNFEV